MFGETVVDVSCSCEALEDLERNREAFQRCWTQVAGLDGACRRRAVEDLLETFNDEWNRDEESEELRPPLDAEQFMARLTPEAVTLHPDGKAFVNYHDGGMFWGHSITVEIDEGGLPSEASI